MFNIDLLTVVCVFVVTSGLNVTNWLIVAILITIIICAVLIIIAIREYKLALLQMMCSSVRFVLRFWSHTHRYIANIVCNVSGNCVSLYFREAEAEQLESAILDNQSLYSFVFGFFR